MDHKREHRTPPTSKGNGSGLTTTSGKRSGEILGQFVLHKWETDTRTEKGDDWKG